MCSIFSRKSKTVRTILLPLDFLDRRSKVNVSQKTNFFLLFFFGTDKIESNDGAAIKLELAF